MGPEMIVCPACKQQKLMVQDYIIVGSEMVCNKCEATLRVTQREPLRVEVVPYTATLNPDSRPESYG